MRRAEEPHMQKSVWNKVFLLASTPMFPIQRYYLHERKKNLQQSYPHEKSGKTTQMHHVLNTLHNVST